MNNLDRYFASIRGYKTLTSEQEIELAERIQSGDENALNQLVLANTRFAVSMARTYMNKGMDLEDLISEANIGLIEAAKRFDPKMGFRFLTYAVFWIRQAILQSFSSQARMIRLPVNVVGTVSQINKAIEMFEAMEDRHPSDIELAKMVGITLKELRLIMKSSARPTSLSTPVGDDEDANCIGDLIEDTDSLRADEGINKQDLELEIKISLRKVLSPKEVTVVSGSFGIGEDPKSDEEIGKSLGVGPERVRQLRDASISKLRKCPEVKAELRYYL